MPDPTLTLQVLRFASGYPFYETEYDGRMESYCFYCGKYQETGQPAHEPDCVHLLAVEAIRKWES